MLGIALAVALLIVVMAVVNGFESELERRILNVLPDASVLGYADGNVAPLNDWETVQRMALERDDVLAAAPFIEGAGLLNVDDALLSVVVRGVDPLRERGVSSLPESVVAGDFSALAEGSRIVIGRQLADALDVGVGDEATLMLPEVRVTPAGGFARQKVFTIAAIFDVGLAEFDRGLVLVSYDWGSRLFGTGGRPTGLSFKLEDIYAAEAFAADFASAANQRFGESYYYEDWRRRHANIFRSIELTKPILFIVLSLVMVIAAFNIVSTLIMVVREKRGDIAILRSIGAAPRNILGIFVVQGSSIGTIGVLGGLALGLALVASIGTIVGWIESWFAIDLLDADVYLIGELPTEARPAEIAQVCALAFGLAVLATLYPAWRASRQPPAETLRHE